MQISHIPYANKVAPIYTIAQVYAEVRNIYANFTVNLVVNQKISRKIGNAYANDPANAGAPKGQSDATVLYANEAATYANVTRETRTRIKEV